MYRATLLAVPRNPMKTNIYKKKATGLLWMIHFPRNLNTPSASNKETGGNYVL